MDAIIFYWLIGLFAGLSAGMLGIGGGLIIVPLLAISFQSQGLSTELIMHQAIATSLAVIVFNALLSSWHHHQHATLSWPTFRKMTPGLMLGAVIGAFTAEQLSSRFLALFIGGFALVMAYRLWTSPAASIQASSRLKLAGLFSLMIGWLSAILGIGGGSLTTPYLLWHRYNIHQAIATSAACGLPIALAGSLTYYYVGLSNPALSNSYIHWPAFISIAVSGLIFTPLGVKLAYYLPLDQLKKGFALLLTVIGIYLMASSI